MADGSQAIDENEKYSLVLDQSRWKELEEILKSFKSKTIQEKIYLEIVHGVEIRLL